MGYELILSTMTVNKDKMKDAAKAILEDERLTGEEWEGAPSCSFEVAERMARVDLGDALPVVLSELGLFPMREDDSFAPYPDHPWSSSPLLVSSVVDHDGKSVVLDKPSLERIDCAISDISAFINSEGMMVWQNEDEVIKWLVKDGRMVSVTFAQSSAE